MNLGCVKPEDVAFSCMDVVRHPERGMIVARIACTPKHNAARTHDVGLASIRSQRLSRKRP